MPFQTILFLSSLINRFISIEFFMKKKANGNNEFNPYTFQLPYDSQINNNNYSFIFDTSSYILWIGNQIIDTKDFIIIETIDGKKIKGNEICTSSDFCWFETDKKMNEGYIGVIGISNKYRKVIFSNEDEKNDDNIYYYLDRINKNQEERYINFIQKDNNEATMIFGYCDDYFKKDNLRKCQCKKGDINNTNIYWCCEISSLKMGEVDIYMPSAKNYEYGIFSISEEYIIAPKTGINILKYYEKYIKDKYNINCTINNNNILIELICEYFNYIELPDLYFIMKENIGIVAFSSDLFKKIDNNKLVFKIKVNYITKEYWYIGEPIVKNYNLLLNYTSLKDAYLIIIPSNLKGFFIIIIAIIGGFIFLFIFIIIIFCIYKKDKLNKTKSFLSSDSPKKDNTFNGLNKNSSFKNNYYEIIEEENEEKTYGIKSDVNIINANTDKLDKRIKKDEDYNNINNDNFNANSIDFSINEIGDIFDENDFFIKNPKK
jgi:hypothetical protein